MNIRRKLLALEIGRVIGALGGIGFAALSAQAALADVPASSGSTTAQSVASSTPTAGSTAAAKPIVLADNADVSAQPASAAAPAQASAPAEATSHQLDSVVVTAQRRAEKIQDVPEAVTAVNGSTLVADTVGSTSSDVLARFVPDASGASPTPTRPRWWIRGVGTGAQGYDVQSPVGVYFDDVYFSNANATGQPVYDLNRVEVLEGPQGTLWGKNTTGGAVNFVSNTPTFTPSGYAKVSEASHDDQLFEGAYGGAINNWLAGRISLHAEDADSLYKNAWDGSSPTYHDDAGRIQFLAKLGNDWSGLLNLHFRDYYSNGGSSEAVGIGPGGLYYDPTQNKNGSGTQPIYADPNSNVVVGVPGAYTDQRQDGLAFTLTGPVGRNTLTSILGYEGFNVYAYSDGPTYYSPTEAINQGNSTSNGDTHQISEELRLASPRSDRDNWVIGTMLFGEDINSYAVTAELPASSYGNIDTTGSPSWTLSTLQQTTKSYSFFGSNTFNFTKAFDVTAGLRFTDEEKSANYLRQVGSGAGLYIDPEAWTQESAINTADLKTGAQEDASHSWSALTWDITPEYKITDNVRAYVRVAHGFRSGGFNTTATTQAAANANGGVVNPEYLTSYEAGLKSEWLDGQLIANGDVFYYKYDDIQVNLVEAVPTGVGNETASTSILTNAAAGKANGAELSFEALPIENLHLTLATDWLNTYYTDYHTGIVGATGTNAYVDFSGNHFVRSPHLSDVFTADYHLPLDNGDSVIFATDWKYQSREYYYGNNQFDPTFFQDGYALGNGHISYVVGKVTYSAYVDNITDKFYKVHSGTPTASSPAINYGGTTYRAPNGNYSSTESPSAGRVIGVSFVTKF